MNPYLKEYQWSNITAMIQNNKAEPKREERDCKGSLVVITGATSGIGYETAKLYASHGAELLLINRNREKSEHLKREIETTYHVPVSYHVADFTHLVEIHETARMLANLKKPIAVLIHNAGVYNTKRRFTEDGLEEVFQVNYLASFLITYALLDTLRAQESARVLYVNSEGHRFALSGLHLDDLDWMRHHYSGLKSYGSAKTAQLLSLIPLSELLQDSNVTINAIHPGDVRTNMGENNGKLYRWFKHHFINPSSRNPELSAQALYYLGISPEVEGICGKFFNFTTEEIPAPHALDKDKARKLWEKSIALTRI